VTAPGGGARSMLLEAATRRTLWLRLAEVVEEYLTTVDELPVEPHATQEEIRSSLASFDFERPLEPLEALTAMVDALRRYQLHVPHPRHFGLFEPAPATMGIAGEALAAAFNPCLATWSGSPFAVELERHLVHAFGGRFGYPPDAVEGTFTSGGSEANLTAVLLALASRLPTWTVEGLRGVPGQPALYMSSHAHPSFVKAARMAGLGSAAVREVPVGADLRLDVAALRHQLAEDRREGLLPLLLVATAGTTGTGAIDPIGACAAVAAEHGLWLHVDAAWGGAAMLVPEARSLLAGIELADSITFDPHKWLSVPMGAGLLLTRRRGALRQVFDVSAALLASGDRDTVDPCAESAQWSRRFIGLKVFLTLAVAGWEGYAALLGDQLALGTRLRGRLAGSGWQLVNDTPLPVVCFVDGRHPNGRSAAYVQALVSMVSASGRARIHAVPVDGQLVARACVTSYLTGPDDVDELVASLDDVRERLAGSRMPAIAVGAQPTRPRCLR
jgi:aromatic-L-amino-acid/L-tryptophan decarboxylase